MRVFFRGAIFFREHIFFMRALFHEGTFLCGFLSRGYVFGRLVFSWAYFVVWLLFRERIFFWILFFS